MRFLLISALLAVLGATPGAAHAADCPTLLAQHRASDLALSLEQFDQDEQQGWRSLGGAGCESQAADLIAAYAALHPHPILTWHQAQMLAKAGRTAEAIEAAGRTLRPAGSDDASGFDWNDYATATIQFLQGDKAALLTSRERLAQAAQQHDVNMPNLRAVDRLVRCFGQPYKAAYACKPAAP